MTDTKWRSPTRHSIANHITDKLPPKDEARDGVSEALEVLRLLDEGMDFYGLPEITIRKEYIQVIERALAQKQAVNEELLNALKDAVFLWDAEKSLINKDDINKWREVIKKAEQEHIYTAPDDLGTALRRLEDHYNILQEKKGQNHE